MKKYRLIIRSYTQRVDTKKNDGTVDRPWYRAVHDEYELTRVTDMGEENRNWAELCRDAKIRNRRNFMCWIPDGYRISTGTHYGLKSYIDITKEPDLNA